MYLKAAFSQQSGARNDNRTRSALSRLLESDTKNAAYSLTLSLSHSLTRQASFTKIEREPEIGGARRKLGTRFRGAQMKGLLGDEKLLTCENGLLGERFKEGESRGME